ncbi:uncharacterized protein LOC135335916 [Halichondria panicea]|uniref:uncharacterized protein LOC135335916 n=1 Tax=Halichondria panicea TaxID=6063 RepID=UPI00312BBC9E
MACSKNLYCLFLLSVLLHTSLGAGDEPTMDVNPNAPKSRGSRFALAFMNNAAQSSTATLQEIGIFITTEQESSSFTLETRWLGVNGTGFTETSPGSGLWSRMEIARRGEFTFISLPAGQGTQGDIAVQNNGEIDEAERQKGLFITAEDPNDELTVYVLNDESTTTDAYMAINCVEFPNAKSYKYFIFSSGVFGGEPFQSRFLFTPCENDTTVSVQASQTHSHPTWVLPSSANPSARVEATYGRAFNRFDTVMNSNNVDLTGSIITSDKPLAVFSGHQCGNPTAVGSCDYLVEQVPPHPTYGDLFFMAPFAVRQSGELYRIGSVSAGAQVTINCECAASSADGNNRVALVSAGNGVYTATVGAGQYAECQTPQSAQTYCCVTSSQPITMAGYTLGRDAEPVLGRSENFDPALYYIPAANSYLNSYSFTTAKDLTTQFNGYLSYILPTRIFDNSTADQQRFRINGETGIPDDQYQAINCRVDGTDQVCAYGGTSNIGRGNFNLTYDNIQNGAFWGFAYGFTFRASFAYPLPFEMEPVGLAWIRAVDRVVVESSVTIVDLMFSITRGDRSERSRAFASLQSLTAEEDSDYTAPPSQRNGGLDQNGNLRWGRDGSTLPNVAYEVTILDDDIPEPVEVVEVMVQCVAIENCYLPRARYTITIIDDQGACPDLPAFSDGSISYNYEFFTEISGRPYGTVATYECDVGTLVGNRRRTCENGVWLGSVSSCGAVDCPALAPIPNGAIAYDPDTIAPFDEGTVATHTCNDGFMLGAGSETRTCLETGRWSGLIPVCRAQCPALENILNGGSILYFPDVTPDFNDGTLATYTCDPGFRLVGIATRLCQISMTWTGQPPVCEPLCPILPPIDNGRVQYSPDFIPDFNVGTEATYTCNFGFRLIGQMVLECEGNGLWSNVPPICEGEE